MLLLPLDDEQKFQKRLSKLDAYSDVTPKFLSNDRTAARIMLKVDWDKVDLEEIKETHGLSINLSDYIDSLADNALDVEEYLSKKGSILKGPQIQKLHFLLNKNVARDAGVINGKRHLPFFDKKGKKDIRELN